jgi:peptidyl-prolyl cis-trans isomerase D
VAAPSSRSRPCARNWRQELVEETGRERAFNELSGKLVDAIYKNPNSLEPAAKSLGLAVQATPAFSRRRARHRRRRRRSCAPRSPRPCCSDGTASDPIEVVTQRGPCMIRVLEHEPEAALPLSQVGNAVVMPRSAPTASARRRKPRPTPWSRRRKPRGLAAAATAATLPLGEANDVLERPQPGAFAARLVDAFFRTPRPQDNLIPVGKARLTVSSSCSRSARCATATSARSTAGRARPGAPAAVAGRQASRRRRPS